MEPLRGKTLCAQHCGNILVVVHGGCAPSDEEWDELFVYAERSQPRAIFVFTPHSCPGPTPTQRSSAAEYHRRTGKAVTLILFTESRLMRGVLTALQWLTQHNSAAHPPAELGSVCDRFEVDAETRSLVLAAGFDMANHLRVADELAYLDPTGAARSMAV